MNKSTSNPTPNTISWNLQEDIAKFSKNIQILDRFLNKCFAKNTFLGKDEKESQRLDIYVESLSNIPINNSRNTQAKIIKDIWAIIMWMSLEKFDEYFQWHTWWETYDSVSNWHKSRKNEYFISWILILKNSKLMSWEKYSFGLAPQSQNTSICNDRIKDYFNALYVKNTNSLSMWMQSLNNIFIDIFIKYWLLWLSDFYKILFLANHDSTFHNIDTFEEKNLWNHDIVQIVRIDDLKNIAYDNENYQKLEEYQKYISTINNLWEQEYVSLKEHQTHFLNAYQQNPEFKTYIYKIFQDLVIKLSIIADKLDNDGWQNTWWDIIDGKLFMQYMLQYTLTFFGRIWNIYEDKYIVWLMVKYDIKLLAIHENIKFLLQIPLLVY